MSSWSAFGLTQLRSVASRERVVPAQRMTRYGARAASCVALVAGLSVASLVVPVSSASAGTNGQEIRVTYVGQGEPSVESVTIKGHNQSGHSETWYGIAPSSSGTETTVGWWWAGPVTIATTYGCGPRTVTDKVTIPTYYPSNVFPVTINLASPCIG